MAWKLYTDAACTEEFPGTLSFVHRTDLSDNPSDSVLWFAEVDEDPGDNQILEKVESTLPGTNYITFAIVDAAVGSGHEADEITLAKTSAGLDTAVAGASLDLGQDDDGIGVIRLLSGVSKAQPIHIRVSNAVTTPGTSNELTSQVVDTIERAKTTA
ncbi:hypothetical protein QHH_33 [Halomonas phage QHHSV-1]|nr:hypothetical protein QHH_33 [Halomonas phage QHHSV-1]